MESVPIYRLFVYWVGHMRLMKTWSKYPPPSWGLGLLLIIDYYWCLPFCSVQLWWQVVGGLLAHGEGPLQLCQLLLLAVQLVPQLTTPKLNNTLRLLRPLGNGSRYPQCAMCNVQCAMCNVQCAMCNVQCAMCNVQRNGAMCNVQCAMCNVQCASRSRSRSRSRSTSTSTSTTPK